MDKNHIAGLLSTAVGRGNIRIDEPMKNHTSFRLGGNADIMVFPGSINQIMSIYRICSREKLPVFVMGNGTNLIVRDKGIRGVVIKIYDSFNKYTVESDTIEAEAGILLSKLSNIALENGLTGFEFASGIPGTLGGAVVMNAGAYDGEMKDVVVETEYLDTGGVVRTLKGESHCFSHRTSFIQEVNGIVLKSKLKLKKGEKPKIRELMDNLNRRRKERQPLELPSAGSVFKRPSGYYTGELIEKCGLKGYTIGGAEISSKHCGFIVNRGGATAEDVINLIRYVQAGVMARFGVELHTEVRIIGEE